MAEEKPKIDIGKEVEKLEDILREREGLVDSITAATANEMYNLIGSNPNVLKDKKKAEEVSGKIAVFFDSYSQNKAKDYFKAGDHLPELGFHATGNIGNAIGNQVKASGKNWNLATLKEQGDKGKEHSMQYPNINLIEGIKALPGDAVKSYLGIDPKKELKDDLLKDAQTMYKIIKGVQSRETLYK